jgi:hypothetical protein
VARTVADLEDASTGDITAGHIAIALSLRVDAAMATPDDRLRSA